MRARLSGSTITAHGDNLAAPFVEFYGNEPLGFPAGWTVTGSSPNRVLVDPQGHAYSPELPTQTAPAAESGGGSLSVTDGTRTVAAATSLSVPNVTDGGDGVAVLGPITGSPGVIYYSEADPGAVGTGAIWVRDDTGYAMTSFFIRNAANDGWVTPSLVAYGPDGLNPTPTAWVQLTDTQVDIGIEDVDENLLNNLRVASDKGFWEFLNTTFRMNHQDGTDGIRILSLPTSDPAVANALWNDAGTVKVSAG